MQVLSTTAEIVQPNEAERSDLCDKREGQIWVRIIASALTVRSMLIFSSRTNIKGLSNILMQLRKICNHPFVFEEVERQISPGSSVNDLLWRSAGKFELLD